MPRKKKTAANGGNKLDITVHGSGSADASGEEDDEFEAMDALEDGELSRAMAEMEKVTGVVAEVVKLTDDKQLWCQNYPVAKFSNEAVASDFGPGTYRIRFKGPNKSYLKGGGTVNIAERLNATPATAAPAPGGVQDLLALLKAEREKQSASWMEWAKLLTPILGPKLLELVLGNKGPSLTELMAVISGAREFHKDTPAPSMTEQMEQFGRMLEIAKGISGDGKDSTGATWVDLLRDGINKVPEVIGQIRGGIPLTAPLLAAPAPVAAPVPQLPPSPGPAGTPAPAPTLEEPMNVQVLAWLKATVQQLLFQASRNRDPALYADVTLDNLPDGMLPATLLEHLGREDWWARLMLLDERVKPYVGWFTEYRQAVLEALQPEPVPTPPKPAAESAEEEFH